MHPLSLDFVRPFFSRLFSLSVSFFCLSGKAAAAAAAAATTHFPKCLASGKTWGQERHFGALVTGLHRSHIATNHPFADKGVKQDPSSRFFGELIACE